MKRWTLAGLASALTLLAFSPSPAEAYYARTSTVLNGSTNIVTVPFPYLQQADVLVTVNGVSTPVTWPTVSTVLLPGAASTYNGKTVIVERSTSIASPDVIFAQGALNPLDLNTMSLQSLYVEQEIVDASSALGPQVSSLATQVAGLQASVSALSAATGSEITAAIAALQASIPPPQITGGGTFTPGGPSSVLATKAGGSNNNDVAVWDSLGNLIDSGVPVGQNPGILTGSSGQIAVFNSAGVAVQGTSILPAGTGAITQGVGDGSDLVATDEFVLNNATAGGRNLLLNGEFSVSQWADTSLAGTPTFTTTTAFVSDRWEYDNTTGAFLTYASRLNAVPPPSGYANDFGFKVNTVQATLGSGDDIHVQQVVEYGNFLRAGFGTANAQPLSLSFWVRASVTGTYGGGLCNSPSLSPRRCYTFSYSITAPNTWTFVGVDIPADVVGVWTTSGSLGTTSVSPGITLDFSLGVGSGVAVAPGTWVSQPATGVPSEVNLEATSGATWYMTGAQLEISNLPTAFEHLPTYQVLLACQRYAYYVQNAVVGTASSSSTLYSALGLPNTMRGLPTIAATGISNRGAGTYTASTGSAGTPNLGTNAGPNNAMFSNPAANWTVGAVITFTGMIDDELF